MKSRIIILMHYMELGGAETALIGLLHALDPAKVDVDLFLHSHRGEMMKYIPSSVTLLPQKKSYSLIESPITYVLKSGYLHIAAARLIAKFKHNRYRKTLNVEQRDIDISSFQYVADAIEPLMPAINPKVEYDLCISFLSPHNYALHKVKAKKKIGWIHTDYSVVDVNNRQELPLWSEFDKIISISPSVTDAFLKRFPSLAPKIIEMENILSNELIRKRAEELSDAQEIMNDGIRLLSVGRFCTAKNYDNVPDIARRLVDKGISALKWYLIGYGGDEALIRQRIKEAGMEEHVIILGKKENPYPYIKACDIYVQPSRYEGKSVTVREAQILGKPVVVTNYPTAPGQINHGIDGVIVPLDNEGCARGIADFIRNTNLQNRIKAHLKTHDFAGTDEVSKIYDLLK